eukprot:885376-Amphidinium_carterae.1
MVSAAATSFGLEFLAAKLSGPKVDNRWLQLLGLLLASIVLPDCRGMKNRFNTVLDIISWVQFKPRIVSWRVDCVLEALQEGGEPTKVNPRQ